MRIQYLEIVTPDVDAVCATYARLCGVTFGEPEAALGNARTASLPDGGKIGVRAPMHEAEEPVVRPYLLVDDVEAAGRIKAAVDLPVIVVGGLRRLADMQDIIDSKQADFVSLARPFVKEPDLVNRLKARLQKRSRCVSCGYCALGCIDAPTRCHQ